jgi:NDP-sugar pyrophosphorylase family protein
MDMLKKNFDVIILCGGYGKRLKPHTLKTPKPLLLVNNKPFVYFLIKKFLKLNVNNIYLATGYKSSSFNIFLKKYFRLKSNIKIINSGKVDVIKRLQDSCKFIKNDFFVCYGDTYVNLNFRRYINFYLKNSFYATVVGAYYKIKYGLVEFDKSNFLIKKFIEKPLIKNPINLGFFIFNNKIISDINNSKSWEKFLKKIIKKRKIRAFIDSKTKHFTFDTPGEYYNIKSKIIK